METLRKKIDRGEELDGDTMAKESIHTLTGIFKLYFRLLPDPVIPFEHYELFISAGGIPDADFRQKCILKALAVLPKHNMKMLEIICMFLNTVANHKDKNLMAPPNLAMLAIFESKNNNNNN